MGQVRRMAGVVLLACCLAVVAGCGGRGAKGKHDAGVASGGGSLAAGDAALAHGEPQEAGRLYLAALKAGAKPTLVHTRMGNLYLSMGNPLKAGMAFKAALAADADNAAAMQGLGFALYLSGFRTEAAATLTKALERDPGLSRAAALLGTIEAREGRPEAALAVYDRSLAVAFDPDVENNRGIALLMLGRTEDAVAAFRKAASAKKSVRIANNLGLALCRMGRYDDAYTVFAGAASEATALNNVGVCYLEAGDKATAQHYFERAIAANPRFYAVAQENLSRLSTLEAVSLPSTVPPATAPAAAPPTPSAPKPAAQSATAPASKAAPQPATTPAPQPAALPAATSSSAPSDPGAAQKAQPLQKETTGSRPQSQALTPAAVERQDRSEMP